MKPSAVKRIFYVDILTIALLILGLIGITVPLFAIPALSIGNLTILTITLTVPLIIFGGSLILSLIALIGLDSAKPWGNAFHTFYSIFMLFFFPIGTILHAYVLYELYGEKETAKYFARKV